MGSGGEAHRSNVATVGAVRLHNTPPFNVVQHAGAVLLTRGQQAAAGVHRHRGHRTSCLRGATKEGDSSMHVKIQGSVRHSPEPCRDVPTTRTQLGTRRSQNRTVLSWEPDAIIHPPQVNTVRMWPVETQSVNGEQPISSEHQGLGSYQCGRSAREAPALADSQWCRCCSLRRPR